MVVNNLIINSGSTISADYFGYEGGQAGGGHIDGYGPGGGGGTTSSVGASGGSYGGIGGTGSGTNPQELYDSIINPTDLGSGGGTAECAGQARDRQGGGAISFSIQDTLTLNGNITTNGEDAVSGSSANGCRSGGGAGGSIWIDVGTFSGSGFLSAIGGNGGRNGDAGGTGADGRISIEYNTNSYTGTFDLSPGQIPSNRMGEEGAFVLRDKVNDHLYIANSQHWIPSTVDEFETQFSTISDITVGSLSSFNQTTADSDPGITLTSGSADFTINDIDDLSIYETTVGNAIYIVVVNDNESTNHTVWGYLGDNTFATPNNVFLVYDSVGRTTRNWLGDTGSFVTSTPSNWTYDIYKLIEFKLNSRNKDQTSGGYGWKMGIENFTINHGQTVDLDSLGYNGGVVSNANGSGEGGGVGTTIGGYGGGGGGHGGAGASGYPANAGGSINDSATAPVIPGGGGGAGEYAGFKPGGEGGGAVKILANSTITLNGVITSNGESLPSADRAGGGAGGSIWLLANNLEGFADITADGGNGGYTDSRGGGGGGGRIALKYCVSNWSGATSVQGGQLPATRQGSVGTVSNATASAGYITNLTSGANAYLSSDWSTDLENVSNSINCLQGVGITDSDNSDKRVAEFDIFFDGNVNFTGVAADTDNYESLFYISGGFENIDGYDDTYSTYSLYVQKGTSVQVGICPNATVIGDVYDGCSGLYYLDATDTNVEVVYVGGTDYWLVSELTNGGAFSEILNEAPVASTVTIDSGANSVNLTNGTITTVSCTGTITDNDGFGNILSVNAKLFRTGVGSGATDDDNNHYTLSGDSECIPSNGSGSSEDYTCDFDVEFHAEATDIGTYSAQDWTCTMTPFDGEGAGTSDSDTIEVNTLYALSITASIDYGQIELGSNTGLTNKQSTITN